jgi:hypothetical protein
MRALLIALLGTSAAAAFAQDRSTLRIFGAAASELGTAR